MSVAIPPWMASGDTAVCHGVVSSGRGVVVSRDGVGQLVYKYGVNRRN